LRQSTLVKIENTTAFKQQLLQWAQQFREVVYLNSNNFSQDYSSYDCIVAVDAFTSLKTDYYNVFEDLQAYQQITKDWLFGYLSYDLKNDTENVQSNNFDGLQFPDLFFFQPKKVFLLKKDTLEMCYLNCCQDEFADDLNEISASSFNKVEESPAYTIEQRISKENYILKINEMLRHIANGTIYEANFCMEFYAKNATIDPISIYNKLNILSEPPFAVYFKNHKHFLLSASPERYLKKIKNKVVSQPIKGTARRHHDPEEDAKIRLELATNKKERSENIMIVDLVRNDLSKTAIQDTVKVTELCSVYTFNQVHHLISTIESEVEDTISPVAIIKSTFPMGSMTGAPKLSAMQIIEQLEVTKRGLYSGAVGYFTPDGDFDFNVVIRSILYNETNRYISFSVGSAITAASTPENEYEECMLKAHAMLQVLR
jgi:para-aminobenzoate synthetase component 1